MESELNRLETKDKHFARRFIQPLGIVNDQQNRLAACAFSQKGKRCKSNQPNIGRISGIVAMPNAFSKADR